MKRDPLEDLLERADGICPPPRLPAGIAGRVRAREKAHWRSTKRMTVAAAVAVLGLGLAQLFSWRPSQPELQARSSSQRLSAVQVEVFRREVVDLDAEAALHHARAGLLQRDELVGNLRRLEPPQSDEIREQIDRARDRAARILVLHANQMISKPTQHAAAEQAYRRAIELFPDTPAAREAVARLRSKGA